MSNPIRALGADIDNQSQAEQERFDQFAAVVSDRELLAVTAFCVIGLFASLLFALWAPLSNEAAAILTAVP
jgi:hypothetical protein